MISSFPSSLGWHKIRECWHYSFRSVMTKQHVTSMLIDQQQTTSETLQEYIQRFSDIWLKSSGLLPHQGRDLAHITHFICNLHNQKLQHYMLGKNPTSVQNAMMLAQKKDTELHIIERLHSHDAGHKINNIASKQVDNKNIIGPCHACSGLYLVWDCNESICNWCRPNLDSHMPAKCIIRKPPNRQQHTAPSWNHSNNIRSQSNSHYDPNLQLSVTTSKPDHITELLEATKEMTKHFKKWYKHNKSNHDSTDSNHSGTNQYNTTHADKHKCKLCNSNDQVNEIIGQTCTPKTTKSEPEDIDPHDSKS